MNRRDTLKAGALAFTSSLLANPFCSVFYRASGRGEINLVNLGSKQNDVTKLMEVYEIPEWDVAFELYNRMLSETSKYRSGGAVVGSVFRSVNNDVMPQEYRGGLFNRLSNVFSGGGFSLGGAYVVEEGAEVLQEYPLTKPETMVNKYGLSYEKATMFCDRYNIALKNAAVSGTVATALVQEALLPIPKEKNSEPQEPSHCDSIS